MNPWHPITNAVDLKHLGKLSEELGECSAATARCIIQGFSECEPTTGKNNGDWLAEELADVLANVELVCERFDVDLKKVAIRVATKKAALRVWHAMA